MYPNILFSHFHEFRHSFTHCTIFFSHSRILSANHAITPIDGFREKKEIRGSTFLAYEIPHFQRNFRLRGVQICKECNLTLFWSGLFYPLFLSAGGKNAPPLKMTLRRGSNFFQDLGQGAFFGVPESLYP